ncbi:hypothetical protein [Rhodococcus sp. IEGM 1330]|uniref:hypothetical protein n=1 Tax=Rhodococcus sp. IEGM 1330 TaxID=3082225 RepID=UPI002953F9FC|nr:hypothetical protein [Rhodococcus sp. IEGM 1330]MDV8022746.1 hypothetical protein [Rhodococcus sp. IEGM 1330]
MPTPLPRAVSSARRHVRRTSRRDTRGIVDLLRTYQGSPVTGFDRPVLLLQGLLGKDVPMTFSNVAPDVHEFLEPLYR